MASPSSSTEEYLSPHVLDGRFRCSDCPQEDSDPAPVVIPPGRFRNALTGSWNWTKSWFVTTTPGTGECIVPEVQVSTDISCAICSRAITDIKYQKQDNDGNFNDCELNWAARRKQWANYAQMEKDPFRREVMEDEPINILALDGGGVRGYLTAQVVMQLLKEEERVLSIQWEATKKTEYEPKLATPTEASRAQQIFVRRFNYLAGTSTGGLIAAALALDYPVDLMGGLYKDPTYFDKYPKNWGGTLWPLYNPHRIHGKIDEVVRIGIDRYNTAIRKLATQIPGLKLRISQWDVLEHVSKVDDLFIKTWVEKQAQAPLYQARAEESARLAQQDRQSSRPKKLLREPPEHVVDNYDLTDLTFGHLNILLNVDYILEQYAHYKAMALSGRVEDEDHNRLDPSKMWEFPHPNYPTSEESGHRYRSLLINTFNSTANKVTIYNSGSRYHSRMPLIHALKGTMAAPTFFPLYEGWRPSFGKTSFVDGGLFANNPELAAYLTSMRGKNQDVIEVYTSEKVHPQTEKVGPKRPVRIHPRMEWSKHPSFLPRNILSLGTGHSVLRTTSENCNGSVWDWLLKSGNEGLLVNTTLEANGSFMERMMGQLASEKHLGINRLRFQFNLTQNFKLDDVSFCDVVDETFMRFFPPKPASSSAPPKAAKESSSSVSIGSQAASSTSAPPGSCEWNSLLAFFTDIIQIQKTAPPPRPWEQFHSKP